MVLNAMILSMLKGVQMKYSLDISTPKLFLPDAMISSMITTTMMIILLALLLTMSLQTPKELRMVQLCQMHLKLMITMKTMITI